MVKFDNIVYVGDKVETKFAIREIAKMELMPEPNKMFTNMLKYCIIDLDDQHFVYGDEVKLCR